MILITTHINADLDGLAAMVGMRLLYPGAVLCLPGAQERSVRELLLEMDPATLSLVEFRSLNLEKVRHLVVVDTQSSERLGPLSALALDPRLKVEVYDHHPPLPALPPHWRCHLEGLGSCASIVVHRLVAEQRTPSAWEATIMAMGIYQDTGGFTFVSTRKGDLTAFAWLLEQGADLPRVGRSVTRQLNALQVRLLGVLLEGLERFHGEGMSVGIATAHSQDYVEDLSVIAHRLLEMERFSALFLVVQMSGRVFLVARSNQPDVIDVGEILKNFGGGGHGSAAFASIADRLLPQIKDALTGILDGILVSPVTARQIMSHPAVTIASDATVDEARAKLTRYGLGGMPVEESGRVVGLITRNILEKANHHGLAWVAVSEFMVSEFASASGQTRLPEIKRILLEERQVMVPVLEEGVVTGCVTRTDLLRTLEERFIDLPPSPGGRLKSSRFHRRFTEELRHHLPASWFARIRFIGQMARQLNMTAYLVGGLPRDLILRRSNLDMDVVVEGDGILLAQAVALESPQCQFRFHETFRTATLIFPGEGEEEPCKVDVATARREHYREPGALPQVESDTIKADLFRRDFTINTMALCLDPERFGLLFDFFGGRRDLRDRAIRILHNLSFVEDPTRLFRAVRFEQELGLRIGQHTLRLLHSAVRMEFLLKLSGKRLYVELQRLLSVKDPVGAVTRLAELDMLRFIHPDLVWSEALRSMLERVREVVAWQRLNGMAGGEDGRMGEGEEMAPWVVYLLALLGLLAPDEGIRLMVRFNPSSQRFVLFKRDLSTIPEVIARIGNRPVERFDGHTLWQLFSPLSIEGLLYLMARFPGGELRRAVGYFWREIRHRRLGINGRDLMAQGFLPGPQFKRILSEVEQRVHNGELKSRRSQLRFVLKNHQKWQ